MGRLKQAASDHPSDEVKAICIRGGPITRVEERQMQDIVNAVGGDYGSDSKYRIDVCKWDLNRFKFESGKLRNQFLNQTQKGKLLINITEFLYFYCHDYYFVSI